MPVRVSPDWVNSKLGLPPPASRTTSKDHLPEISAANAKAEIAKSRTRVFMRAILSFARQMRGGLGQDRGCLFPIGRIRVLDVRGIPVFDGQLGIIVGLLPFVERTIDRSESEIGVGQVSLAEAGLGAVEVLLCDGQAALSMGERGGGIAT